MIKRRKKKKILRVSLKMEKTKRKKMRRKKIRMK